MKYVLLRPFVREFEAYSAREQEAINETIQQVLNWFDHHQTPHGLGIKKLLPKIYEARINIHLRVAFFLDKDTIKFFCLGNHDDIKHMLKTLRS